MRSCAATPSASRLLLERVDHLLCLGVNVQRLELGEGALEAEQRQHGRAVGLHLEAARARLGRTLLFSLAPFLLAAALFSPWCRASRGRASS